MPKVHEAQVIKYLAKGTHSEPYLEAAVVEELEDSMTPVGVERCIVTGLLNGLQLHKRAENYISLLSIFLASSSIIATCSRSGPADKATRAYDALAKDSGLSLLELSLRWALGREALTSVLLGSSR